MTSQPWDGSPELTARITAALEASERGESEDIGDLSEWLFFALTHEHHHIPEPQCSVCQCERSKKP
jgi:hypothetical protein